VWRWLTEAAAVAAKDLRAEFRTKVAVNSLGLFALTTLVAVAYAVGPYRIAAEDRPYLLSVLLWIVLLFAALAGLDRSFVKEEESHTAPLLRLSAAPPAVWAGKLLYNLVLLYLLMAAVVPLFIVLMGFEVELAPWFILLLITGGFALAVTATIVAAIIARAISRGALYSVLSLPLMLPLVIFLIQGTSAAAQGNLEIVQSSIRAVVSLGGVMTVVSAFLFPFVWSE
jgi:heme exporter protein B